MDLEKLKYPLGHYHYEKPSEETWNQWIEHIESMPSKLTKLVSSLSFDAMERTYRPGGWNVKQIVHHFADSHINAFARFKIVLTEESPTIRTYRQTAWAEREDASNEEITDSLDLLSGLHKRWAVLLKTLKPQEKDRKFIHPEYEGERHLEWLTGLYAWHCRHHLAHIKLAIEKESKKESK
ncbi:MAG: YfiT family bacillithiol transferase [Bacteroidota bacterium]